MWNLLYKLLQPVDWLATLAADWRSHFLASASAGSLVWLLTSIICFVLSSAWDRGIRKRGNLGVDYSTLIFYAFLFIFWLGPPIAVSVLVHGWLDGLYAWYTTPLGPPLELVVP